MLCNICSGIEFDHSQLHDDDEAQFLIGDENSATKYFVYHHQPSIDALRAAAIVGCHLCSLIREELFHIRGHERNEAYHNGPIEIRYYPKIREENQHPSKNLLILAKTPLRDVKILFDLVQYSSPIEELLAEKVANCSESTGSMENLKLATVWVSRCLTTHKLCTISTTPYPQLPSRILDVESPEAPEGLRLCSAEGRHGPYITLSHVWGHDQVITTTLSTLKTRMTSIQMKSLSLTFQDAVFVARQMSVRYLWIDTLCIIQDSIDDWAKESSRMGGYYLNSLFCIAAVSASSGSDGCFAKRNPLSTTPSVVTIRLLGFNKNEPMTWFIRSSSSWDPVNQTTAFQRPPLWQRAWVVQERLLSPRMLRFSSMQLSWKCRTEVAAESVPEGIPDSYMGIGDRVLRDALVGVKLFQLCKKDEGEESPCVGCVHSKDSELIDLYNAWYDLVTLYGKCSLTKESDIFPAISGIAKAIADATGDRYVAGLWKHDLHRGLLWSTPDSTSARVDLRSYRAPSWSWASLKAGCTFYVREISQVGLKVDTGHFRIEEITQLRSEINPFGEVNNGKLKIKGLLKQAHPQGGDSGDEIFRVIPNSGDRHALFDLEQKSVIGYYFADNIDRAFVTQIWCSPVMTEADDTPGRQGQTEVRGLALLLLEETERVFMRVGSVWIKDFSWFTGCTMGTFSII